MRRVNLPRSAHFALWMFQFREQLRLLYASYQQEGTLPCDEDGNAMDQVDFYIHVYEHKPTLINYDQH